MSARATDGAATAASQVGPAPTERLDVDTATLPAPLHSEDDATVPAIDGVRRRRERAARPAPPRATDDAVDRDALADAFTALHPELTRFVLRMVLRPAVAEELVQEAFARALAAERRPAATAELRPWLFTIAANLARDERKRRGFSAEVLVDLRAAAEADPAFVARAAAIAGTPETKGVAREHLAVCFGCTMTALPEDQAAALLLREVHGFTVDETAAILDVRPGQVKGRVAAARATMTARYADTCALVGKGGVCHQCVELDGFFRAGAGDPLAGRPPTVATRLAILADDRAAPLPPWTRMLGELLDEL